MSLNFIIAYLDIDTIYNLDDFLSEYYSDSLRNNLFKYTVSYRYIKEYKLLKKVQKTDIDKINWRRLYINLLRLKN